MGVITIPLWLAFFLILGVFFLLAFAERGIFVEFLKSFLFKTISKKKRKKTPRKPNHDNALFKLKMMN